MFNSLNGCGWYIRLMAVYEIPIAAITINIPSIKLEKYSAYHDQKDALYLAVVLQR